MRDDRDRYAAFYTEHLWMLLPEIYRTGDSDDPAVKGPLREIVERLGAQAASVRRAIDRFGGDYKSFDLKSSDGDDACKAACAADNKCRAWTYARPGYAGKEAHCFLKKDIKPPRRKAGFTSGVVR